jgi:hypothetical protein
MPNLGDLGRGLGNVFNGTFGGVVGNLNDALKQGKQVSSKDFAKVIEKAKDEGEKQLTEEGKRYLEETVKRLDVLNSTLDQEQLKRKILEKAESFCETYLEDKLQFLLDLGLRGIPKVNLGFDGKEISCQILIHIILRNVSQDLYRTEWITRLVVNITQDVSKIEVPSFDFKPESNNDYPENKRKELEEKLEEQRDILIAQLMNSVLEDYLPGLKVINEVIRIFG